MFKTENKDYTIRWQYSVVLDAADELGFEFVSEVSDVLRSFMPEVKKVNKKDVLVDPPTKVKTVRQLAVIIKHMIKAEGGEIEEKEILNNINSLNITNVITEVIKNSPKENGDVKDDVKKKELAQTS